jgi:hypothetical protein
MANKILPSEGFIAKMFGKKKKPEDTKKTPPATTPKGKSTFDKVKEGYSIFKGAAKKPVVKK